MHLAAFDPELQRVGLGFQHRLQACGTDILQRVLYADVHPRAERHEHGNGGDSNTIERPPRRPSANRDARFGFARTGWTGLSRRRRRVGHRWILTGLPAPAPAMPPAP